MSSTGQSRNWKHRPQAGPGGTVARRDGRERSRRPSRRRLRCAADRGRTPTLGRARLRATPPHRRPQPESDAPAPVGSRPPPPCRRRRARGRDRADHGCRGCPPRGRRHGNRRAPANVSDAGVSRCVDPGREPALVASHRDIVHRPDLGPRSREPHQVRKAPAPFGYGEEGRVGPTTGPEHGHQTVAPEDRGPPRKAARRS